MCVHEIIGDEIVLMFAAPPVFPLVIVICNSRLL